MRSTLYNPDHFFMIVTAKMVIEKKKKKKCKVGIILSANLLYKKCICFLYLSMSLFTQRNAILPYSSLQRDNNDRNIVMVSTSFPLWNIKQLMEVYTCNIPSSLELVSLLSFFPVFFLFLVHTHTHTQKKKQ